MTSGLDRLSLKQLQALLSLTAEVAGVAKGCWARVVLLAPPTIVHNSPGGLWHPHYRVKETEAGALEGLSKVARLGSSAHLWSEPVPAFQQLRTSPTP